MAARPPLQATSGDVEALRAELRSALARIEALERMPAGVQVQTTDFSPRPGQIVTAEPPPAGLGVLLPAARPQVRNARITVSARNANPIRWEAVGGTVNGVRMVTSNAVGIVEAVCDGAAWHISQGAASPTGSVASTSGATYFLQTADTGLPNARVGTDSTEIDVDYTVASVVSWALRSASVVFSKLQDLTGLSVLGRAANSAGVMAAITASNAREVLRVNDAGTALEWGQPVGVWAPDGTDQGDFNTLDFRSQTSIIADGGSFSGGRWQVRMKRAALTGVILAGEDENDTTFDSSVAGAGLSLSSGDTVLDWDGVLVSQGPTGIGTFRSLDFIDGTNTTAGVADVGGGVVAITFNVDLSSVTYTAGDGLSLSSNEFSVDASAIAGGGLVGFGSVLSVVGGDGIDVAADSVAVDVSDFAGDGLVDDGSNNLAVSATAIAGTGLEDDGGNNLRIAASAAGNGLTGGAGSALAVGAGTGITVNANDVAVSATWNNILANGASSGAHNPSIANGQSLFVAGNTQSDALQLTAQSSSNNGVIFSRGALLLTPTTNLSAICPGTIALSSTSGGAVSIAAGLAAHLALSSGGSGGNIQLTAGSSSFVHLNGQPFLVWDEAAASTPSLAAGQGMVWVRSDTPNVPMFTDDANADHEIAFPIDDDGKDVRTMSRCILWDDFCSVEGATFAAGAFGAIVCDTGWIVTNNTLAGTATITQFDGGTGGPSNAPGQLQVSTSNTTGTQIDLTKGNNNTCRWLRASDVKSLKMRVAVQQSTSVHVTFGLNDSSFGSTDCARFDFDSSLDSTWHIISNANSGTADNDDTNVTPGTAMQMLEIRSPSPSSLNWEFYRNGTLLGTQTVSTKTRGCNVHLSIANLAASDRTFRVDYVSLETWELSR